VSCSDHGRRLVPVRGHLDREPISPNASSINHDMHVFTHFSNPVRSESFTLCCIYHLDSSGLLASVWLRSLLWSSVSSVGPGHFPVITPEPVPLYPPGPKSFGGIVLDGERSGSVLLGARGSTFALEGTVLGSEGLDTFVACDQSVVEINPDPPGPPTV
jgi:hypothetical protein